MGSGNVPTVDLFPAALMICCLYGWNQGITRFGDVKLVVISQTGQENRGWTTTAWSESVVLRAFMLNEYLFTSPPISQPKPSAER